MFGLKEAKDTTKAGSKITKKNFICWSEQLLLISMSRTEYSWMQERERITQLRESSVAFAQMPCMKRLSAPKLANLCANMKIKFFDKDAVVKEKFDDNKYLLIVREGKLRLDMIITFENTNAWPVTHLMTTGPNMPSHPIYETEIIQP